ncbi:MAG: hypothetical protein GX425_07385 [Peptococcaceae bacterium]|nr:hypothetical protein [Peptococcaceae bacterium]
MNTLERNLKNIITFLKKENVPYMVIGGIANVVWGRARLTQDLDITIFCKETDILDLIKKLTGKFKVLPDEPYSFVKQTRVLPLIGDEGLRIDLIFGQLPYEELAMRRAKTVKLGNISVKICTAEDLIIHKIISERPIDKEDIRWIIKRQNKNLDREYLDAIVKELSYLLEKQEIWKFYLDCFH